MGETEKAPDAAEPSDAVIKIYISPDLLKATIYIEPPANGGADATPRMIDDALRTVKLVHGLDTELLEGLKRQPVYSREMILARGVAPVDGIDGSIKYKFRVLIEPHPKMLENGTVDYRDLGIIENAKAGDVLCDITLPTKGTEGISVTGKKLAQAVGLAVDSPLGRNTKLSDDQKQVIALVNGHVILVNSKVNVSDTFVVEKDVDNSTGNIRCVGSVKIFGNVLENFLVEAGGNVDIYGAVEGGFVKAAGNINAHGGIVGKSRSVIECKGNLVTTFMENCTAEIDGTITADSIMHSIIKCGQSLELVGMRAKLIGGRCIVSRDLTANVIGSPANLPTELILGVDPALITSQAALIKQIAEMKAQMEKLGQIVTLLSQYEGSDRLTPAKAGMLASSKLSLNVTNTKFKIKQKELEHVRQKIEGLGKGKIVCRGVIHRGVRLSIGMAHMNIEEPVLSSVFTCVDGNIIVNSSY